MGIDRFAEMKGLTLEGMRGLASTGRAIGKFELSSVGDRWALVFSPPGGKQSGWVNGRFYLMSEKSRKPRLFARADTALRIVRQVMPMPGIWVSFWNWSERM